MRFLVTLPMILCLAGCTWVKLTGSGEGVTVVSQAPSSCQRLGTTTSVTKADVASIGRGDRKVAGELETLARNNAARMGGDTISAAGGVSPDGEQTFVVYRCGAP